MLEAFLDGLTFGTGLVLGVIIGVGLSMLFGWVLERIKEPVLKQDNMVLDWRELYGHLLRDSSREVLALYLGVSQAYLKAIEDDWAVPSVKVQTRMVQFETAKTKTTTREVLKRFHLETSKNANR